MRFTFISTMIGSPWGGSEELWSQAAIQLKGAGHDVQAFVPFWPRLSDRVKALERHGIRTGTYPSYHAGVARHLWDRFSLAYRRSCRRLKQFRPDLAVISQGYNSDGLDWAGICREAAIPYAMIVHCNSEYWWFRERFDEAVATYTGARKVCCVSRHNLDLLRRQVAEPLLHGEVVYNPYKVSSLPPPPWPDESGGWRLACVSRIELAAKGQDLLLRTLARPEWRDRPLELNLFGAGPDETVLRRLCGMLGLNNVHLRGHMNDVRALWERNHLLVLPSRYEGLPLALVEAMWCGRPAVVTDVGGNAALCADNETGFVATAATASCFARTLERAWERRKEWASLGLAARRRVEEEIPKDPVGLFCERLIACARANS